MERVMSGCILSIGGRQMFITGGVVTNLSIDIAHLQPTVVVSVPRIFIRYYEGFMSALAKKSLYRRALFWGTMKLRRWMQARHYDCENVATAEMRVFQAAFGKECAMMITAGAALESRMHEFLQVLVGSPLRNGFGCSESGTGTIITPDDIAYLRPGTAGGPLPNSACKIVPVEGYDEPGCGEILIGGHGVCVGYLNDEEATRELFADEERHWVWTGDIGKWVDGSLVVVDRMRSIFKLVQGEYVAAEMVTHVYEEVTAIEQIFVYGDSGRLCLVAIVIPRRAVVAGMLNKEKLTDEEFKAACRNAAVKEQIMEAMNSAAKAKGLFGFQQVKGIYLDSVLWSPDNNLLTPTFKVRRKALADYYRNEIEAVYAEAAARINAESKP
jgi:long-chain acyl-CoA synthetase